jgi:nucleotide-binding universal stress UspA family protein
MTTRILVAVDLSDASIEVLREGRALATARGAALAVVHVLGSFSDMQPLFPQGYAGNMTDALELEQIVRQSFARRVSEVEGCADAELFFERGVAYAEIVRRAEAWQADLLLVGSRGHTGLTRALLGSVAEKVVRYAHCPVLVFRPSRHTGVVLAATDLSDASLPAVAMAVSEARVRGARLMVAHVVDDWYSVYGSSAGVFFGISAPLPPAGAREASLALLRGALDQAVKRFDGEGEVLVLEGKPAAAIARAVEERDVELLVIATHGRTGLSRLLVGSVAEELVRLASCSVLVVRQVTIDA